MDRFMVYVFDGVSNSALDATDLYPVTYIQAISLARFNAQHMPYKRIYIMDRMTGKDITSYYYCNNRMTSESHN
jgi:hypothetical protein